VHPVRLENLALATFFVTPAKVPFAGSHAYLDATADPVELGKLAARFRGAKLVAVATGAASGIDILDIDPRNGGDRWLFENHERLVRTRIHETRRGGWHFIFKHSVGLRSDPKFANGVEFLSSGRWAVWWPEHAGRVLCEGSVAVLPDWLHEALARQQSGRREMGTTCNGSDVVPIFPSPTPYEINYAKKALGNAFLEMRSCPPGEGQNTKGRNTKLNGLAYSMGRLIARGWVTRERVEAMLLKGADQCGLVVDDGLRQCRATVDSGINAGLLHPYHDIEF
jgi:hypothetical protein